MIKDSRLLKAIQDGFKVAGLRVLEPSCGHGCVTRDLCEMGAEVTSFDIRQSNIDKASDLCLADCYAPEFVLEDACNISNFGIHPVIVHFGLLYHLECPRAHLVQVLNQTEKELLLDTHVCEDVAAQWINDGCSGAWWYEGADDYAARPGQSRSWWMTRDVLRSTIEEAGFIVTQLSDEPKAANGRRVLYRARRR